MKISLMVLSTGSAAGKALPINVAQFIIGRDPGCNLRPASAMISKRHCAVLVKNGKVSLRDFDSTNGSFVNDAAVKGEVVLKNGDVLKVGPLTFKLVIEGMPAPTKPTPPPKPKSADEAQARQERAKGPRNVTRPLQIATSSPGNRSLRPLAEPAGTCSRIAIRLASSDRTIAAG